MTDFMFVPFAFLLTQAAGLSAWPSCKADPVGQQGAFPRLQIPVEVTQETTQGCSAQVP